MTIRPITKYITDDQEFSRLQDAEDHQHLCMLAHRILSKLGPGPKSSNGYVQHPRQVAATARRDFIYLFRDHHTIACLLASAVPVHPSHYDRYFYEVLRGYLSKAWYRLSCMDDQGREFSQPYFVNHPNEAVLEA